MSFDHFRGTNIQILAVYRAHYPDSKIAKNSRISIQHINIKKFIKSQKKITSLKFATTLKTLGTDAKNIKASVFDYMNKFVYTVEWEDKNGQRSSLLRTCDNVFDYIECQINGSVLGIGARDVPFGPGYKIFVATDNGFFEEQTTPSFTETNEDLVMESMRASSFRGSGGNGFSSNIEKLSDKEQEDLVYNTFRNYMKDPQDNSIALQIKRERATLNQPTLQPYLVSQTFKIVEEVSRNLVQATKSQNEDLSAVFDIRKRDTMFQDMITIELNKKHKKLQNWNMFLLDSGLLTMLDSDSKSKILEAEEILTNVQEIRKAQRDFVSTSEPGKSEVAKEFFQKSFANFLENNELSKRKSQNQINSGTMDQEGVQKLKNFNKNSDMFFLYPKKCNMLIPSMLKVTQQLYNAEDIHQEDHKHRMKILASLMLRMLQNNQRLRTNAQKQNKVLSLNNTWWFHDVEFLDNMSKIYLAFVEDQSLDVSNDSEAEKAEHDALVKNLSILTVKELNQAQSKKGAVQGIEAKQLNSIYDNHVQRAMNTLLNKKNYKEAVEIAKFIKNQQFICILFINKGIDFAIEDIVEEWGQDFLLFLVRYSCSAIIESSQGKPYYKVSSISNIFNQFRMLFTCSMRWNSSKVKFRRS